MNEQNEQAKKPMSAQAILQILTSLTEAAKERGVQEDLGTDLWAQAAKEREQEREASLKRREKECDMKAWALFGILVQNGLIEPPDLTKLEEEPEDQADQLQWKILALRTAVAFITGEYDLV